MQMSKYLIKYSLICIHLQNRNLNLATIRIFIFSGTDFHSEDLFLSLYETYKEKNYFFVIKCYIYQANDINKTFCKSFSIGKNKTVKVYVSATEVEIPGSETKSL